MISKSFDFRNYIIKDFSHSFESGFIYGIAGRNGAGKSTLMKMLSGLISPTKGDINIVINGTQFSPDELKGEYGFSAPYLDIYEEFSPNELVKIYSDFRSQKYDLNRFQELLEIYDLATKSELPIQSYSSGMKQRVKLILSLLFENKILFWDEPGSNLDQKGIDINLELIKEKNRSGTLCILASNDSRELDICDKIIDIDEIFSSN